MNAKGLLSSRSRELLGAGLIVSAFVGCGDDSKSSPGGASGSAARAGSSASGSEAGGSGSTDAGPGGRASSGGTPSEPGAGGRSDGEAGEPSDPVGGASDTDAGGSDAGGSGNGGASAGGSNGGTGNTGNVSSIPGAPCDVALILQQKCNACHNDPPVLDAPFALTTYDALVEHADAVQEVMEADLMPPSPLAPLPEAEHDALLGWIEAGAPFTNGPCD